MKKLQNKQQRILAIETSGSTCGIALAENGKVVQEVFWRSALKASERIVPAVAEILEKAGWKPNALEKIAVSVGPGSFTGIRVGLSCAKTMGQSLGIPIVGINSLEILEAAAPKGPYEVVSAIDALRDEIYVKNSHGSVVVEDCRKYAEKLAKRPSNLFLTGTALLNYGELLRGILKGKLVPVPARYYFPRAGVLALLASPRKGLRWNKVEPLYIRRSWAEEKRDAKRN